MADFRKWLTVLAVIAVMACAANAQIGVIPVGGSANSLLACNATAAGTPELRPEGYTELAGDIVISCTGGPTMQLGANIPTTNIIVYMSPAVPITSRFLSSNGASEALLIIDEAGSTIGTGVTGAYGPKAPQNLCTYSQEVGNVGGNGSVCNAVVGSDGNGYEVAVTNSGTGTCNTAGGFLGCGTAPNVYQGKVGDYGVNTVTFYNVPVLPPATSGVSRTFRITNVRVPVPGGQLNGTLQATLSTNPNQTLPVSGGALNIGVVGPAMTAAVKLPSSGFPFQQCVTQSMALSASLIFTEGFATGFKTRVVPGGQLEGVPGNATGNTTWAAEGTNNGSGTPAVFQNIPGGLYGGFAANTESGLILPSLTTNNTGTGAINYTAGLADYGTRLRALFYNIPSGLTMYVSTVSAGGPSPNPWGGTSVTAAAVLVATSSGESTPDGTAFSPIAATNFGGGVAQGTSVGTLPAIALSANSSGVAEAVWEVVNSNPSAIDSLTFGVYIAYKPTAASATNPYGTPITGLPLGSMAPDVALSFADDPTILGISTANATQGDTPIPRFAVLNNYQGAFTTINLCQTTLLYPFVTGASGFDTGIAVANTSWDFGTTVHQIGSCTLYAYGVTVAAAGNTPLQTTVPGCDSLANPVAGTNCFPVVPAGQVQSVLASATLTNFQGYVIALCNFQFAHGYAAVTDLGIRNLWSSYLALELSNATIGSSSRASSVLNGVETLAH